MAERATLGRRLAIAVAAIVLGACGFERVIDLPTAQPTASPVPSSWTRSWELMENAGRNLTIGVHMANKECERLADVRVNESADGVEIRAFGARLPGSRVCPLNLVVRQFTVTLEEPLGDRALSGCHVEGRPPLPADCGAVSP